MAQSIENSLPLQHLFDVALQYRPEMKPVMALATTSGSYMGSGDGSITGPALKGTVRWDLYEVVGEVNCQTQFVGMIAAADGTELAFDARGHGLIPDPAQPQRWHMAFAVHLTTSEPEYAWLTRMVVLWDGEFSTESLRHRYRAFGRLNNKA